MRTPSQGNGDTSDRPAWLRPHVRVVVISGPTCPYGVYVGHHREVVASKGGLWSVQLDGKPFVLNFLADELRPERPET